MNHDELQKLMSSYLDGEANEADKAILLSHLDDCTECRLFIDHANQIHKAIRALGEIELSHSFASRTVQVVERGNDQVEEWLGVEPLARNTFFAIAITVFLMFVLTSMNNAASPGITEVLMEESGGDSVATQVLLQPGDFSKNDLLYAVMTK
jgi:predicted anti-sigma-YlaC factor YlaD